MLSYTHLFSREEVPELIPMRAKLYKMLEESNDYSPDRLLEEFPTNILLEERALILGRLKKHDNVLSIYIHVLGDVAKATAYAEAHYKEDKHIFHTLIKCILIPPTQPLYDGVPLHPDFSQVNRDVALEILNTHATRIDPFEIFEVKNALHDLLEIFLNHFGFSSTFPMTCPCPSWRNTWRNLYVK